MFYCKTNNFPFIIYAAKYLIIDLNWKNTPYTLYFKNADISDWPYISFDKPVKPYSGRECTKTFSVSVSLQMQEWNLIYVENVQKKSDSRCPQKHQRNLTGKAKVYSCTECMKACPQTGNLQKHQIIHSGVKAYLGEECTKTLSQADILQTHQRRHRGVKSYSCRECTQIFVQANALKTHQRIHSGVIIYYVECRKTFALAGRVNAYSCRERTNKFSAIRDWQEHQIIQTRVKA